jgi:hypothetical protein
LIKNTEPVMSKRESSSTRQTPSKKTKVAEEKNIAFDEIKSRGQGVCEGEWEGKPAVFKRNINKDYMQYYRLWTRTPFLPEVYATITEGTRVTVVMEKLVPFVYDSSRHDEYVKAAEEVYSVSKFENMDISPANTLMRENGQIVLVDQWTTGFTPIYWVEEDDKAKRVRRSIGRVLLHFKEHEKIKKLCNEAISELKAALPTIEKASYHLACDRRFYDPIDLEDICFYGLIRVLACRNLMRTRRQWLAERGKSFDDIKAVNIRSSTMPEYDKMCDQMPRYYVTFEDCIAELGIVHMDN